MSENKSKSKWLFLVKGYIPEPDANGNCVAKLRSELAKAGIMTDVLRVRMSKKVPDVLEDDAGRIYSADTWMRFGKLGRFESVPKYIQALRLPRVVAVRGWHCLTNGRYADEKAYGQNACRNIKRRLEQLCRENKYEWVIAVGNPFCTQETAASADLGGARLAFYSLDPYSRNYSFSKKNEKKRSAEEMAVMKKAEIHFVSLEHEQDWLREPQNEFFSKIHCLPYPNLMRQRKVTGKIPEGLFESENINCVYLGGLLDGIRSPKRTLELFEKMMKLDSRIKLYVIGKKDGAEICSVLNRYKEKMGESMIVMDSVDFGTAEAIMNGADVLVNIGNLIPNQMPSKLLDYIATGKPIICVSELEPCNMQPYWSRYPVMFRTDAEHTSDENTAAQAVRFCNENKGKRVEWDEIRERFKGFVAEDVAKEFAESLGKIK